MVYHKYFILACSVFFILLGSSLDAQILPAFDSKKASITKQYIYSYGKDIRDVCLAPAHWQTKQWLTFSGVALGTFALFTVDEQIQQWSQEQRTDFSNRFSEHFLDPWGTGNLLRNYTVYSLAGVYFTGLLTKNEKTKMVAMEATRAWAVSSLFIFVTKVSFGRHRPHQGPEPDHWQWEGPTTKSYRSFVSGHTMAAWAAASVFAQEYKDKPIVPIVSYTIAGLVGLSRIHDNKHWASDVFAAAAFGWAIGKLVVNRNNWGVKISAAQQGQGVALRYNF
ncbi:MAG: phosphatase PAP2 family protein [Bacteroidales bacterium]|nr:phosphatase PAP2 family protein [Bacteroidales bacterium]MCF8455300.1 phosphatase PAP2 family protein [Bacteroidales bacterium]